MIKLYFNKILEKCCLKIVILKVDFLLIISWNLILLFLMIFLKWINCGLGYLL